MRLIELQQKFSLLLSMLIRRAYELGYTITMGEVWRPSVTAKWYAKLGIGIANSVHCDRLAADINLFKDGVLLTATMSYKVLGEYWKSLSHGDVKCCWGGDFRKPDGCHFSIENEGRR